MLLLPQKGRQRIITNDGVVGTLTPGTAVTTGATAPVKGTAVEIISAASNTQDSYGIVVQASNYALAATLSEGALDILIGGATDDIIIPNLLMGYCPDNSVVGNKTWFFPLLIPAGVRIAAQAAGTRVSTAMRVRVQLIGGQTPPWKVGSKVTTYGMGTVPNGTTIVPGASGAAQTVTQITASTTEDHFAFFPSFQPSADTTVVNKAVIIGIGVGASVEDIIGQWWYGFGVNEEVSGPYWPWPAFADVPSGTRLTMLASSSGALETGYNGVIHAVS